MDILDPLTSPDAWDRELAACPGATVFHSAAWARLLGTTYGHRPLFLRVRNGTTTTALVPLMEVRSPVTGRRGVGLPFSDLCPPLVTEGVSVPALRDTLETLAREHHWKHLELRGGPLPAAFTASAAPAFLGHELDLTPGAGALHSGLDASVRRALRKSERHGVTVRISTDESALRAFYALHQLTRRRHGLPPQSWAFFRNLRQEKLIAPEAGFVALASLQDRPLAAAVFLRHGSAAVYKFGASDEREWAARPNHSAMWEGIRHLAASGARTLHFGRTSLGQEGLRRFKLSWGTREAPISYARFSPVENSWQTVIPAPAGRLAHAVFHHLPLSLNRLAGRLLYPHID